MKKIIIFLLVIAVLISCLYVFNSYSFENIFDGLIKKDTEREVENAKELLAEEEILIYNVLVEHLPEFKDPASVKIIEVNRRSKKYAVVRLSGMNTYGGIDIEDYIVFLQSYNLSSGTLISNAKCMYEYDEFCESKKTNNYGDGGLNITDYEEFSTYLEKNSSKELFDYNIGRMNAALKEYKKAQGWIE